MPGTVLMLASVASMIDQFNIPNIKLLIKMGYQVDVACNFIDGNTCSDEKIAELKNKLKDMSVDCYQIDFARSVKHIWQNVKAYRKVLKLMQTNHYAFVHCHSPIGGVCGRLAGHRTHTKVIYTAHGFHFYKGAPLLNWLIYYPIEKFLSRYTDVLITINKEDYAIAKKKMHAKKTEYIPGVGIDVEKIQSIKVDRHKKREELGLPQDAFVLISVGELNKNKNHEVVIKTLKDLANKNNIHYIIVGQGVLYKYLLDLTCEYGLKDKVHLLGFRTDVIELFKSSDCFVFPSLREGLGLSALEAMASGLPLIATYVGGIKDYAKDGITGYCLSNSMDIVTMSDVIVKMLYSSDFCKECSHHNIAIAKQFDIHQSLSAMEWIYEKVEGAEGDCR